MREDFSKNLTKPGEAERILFGEKTPATLLDSVSGAPFRAAVSKLQDDVTDVGGAGKAAWDQFGEDPEKAPSMEDIVGKAGVEDERLKKILGFVGSFAEPGVPGMGPMLGMAKKVKPKQEAEIIDLVKMLREMPKKELDPIDKLHGNFGKIIGVAEDTLPNEAGRYMTDRYMERAARTKKEADALKASNAGKSEERILGALKESGIDPESFNGIYARRLGVEILPGSKATKSQVGIHRKLGPDADFDSVIDDALQVAEEDGFKKIFVYRDEPRKADVIDIVKQLKEKKKKKKD